MDTLTFAMGPVQLDDEGDELRHRLARRLGEALGRSVRVISMRTYAQLGRLAEEGGAEVFWMPPAVYARAESTSTVRALSTVERARGAGYRGVLFVASTSSIRTPAELAGKRMVWMDRDSCAGHLFIRLALAEQGIVASEVLAEERFVGSYGAVVNAVLNGEADAGATYAQVEGDDDRIVLAGWQVLAGKDAMRPLLVSGPIPPDVISVRAGLDEAERDALGAALHALHQADDGELVDELFGGIRLVPATRYDYAPVRAALEASRQSTTNCSPDPSVKTTR